MKKVLLFLSVLFLLIPGVARNVSAEDSYDYDLSYDVVFTADEKIIYRDPATGKETTDITKDLPDMLPGDSMKVTFNLKNEYPRAVDWYMYNNSEAFEQLSKNASDAAYDYELTYTAKADPLYSSDVVGGDTMMGINEATDVLKDYFLLQDSFAKGRNESVTLVLSFDGETQINSYQLALGKVKFRFAVEIPPESTEKHEHKIIYIPYTGDSSNMNVYIIAEAASLLLLGAALYAYYRYLKKQREA